MRNQMCVHLYTVNPNELSDTIGTMIKEGKIIQSIVQTHPMISREFNGVYYSNYLIVYSQGE